MKRLSVFVLEQEAIFRDGVRLLSSSVSKRVLLTSVCLTCVAGAGIRTYMLYVSTSVEQHVALLRFGNSSLNTFDDPYNIHI